MDICRQIFANVENWTQATLTAELPFTKGRMQKRTLVHNIASCKTISGEYLKNIMGISSEYPENIREISVGGMELGESSRYLGCDRAHKDFCNLGGTNRRLDLG